MDKRYRKMAKEANGKIREIRDGQVVLEVFLPVADALAEIRGQLKRTGGAVNLAVYITTNRKC